ncbi:MAG: putative superfamily transporter inner rane protein [Phycisphaerales bacterium]|nr:putative superfamily transporter inner rane protein [Phycisphaerales bacterium]
MSASHRHFPVAMLVLACLFWGMGFSWAKNFGNAINQAAGQPSDAAVGPLTGLTLRFATASLLWLIVVPASRRGWTWQTAWHGGLVGAMLGLGLILQHVGLGLSDESVIAFLTNLTVIFVPIWVLVATRQRPRMAVLVAVPVALIGMALLAGLRTATSTGGGAWWGVACAAAFAAEILLLDRLGRDQSPARITLLLFLTATISCGVIAPLLPGFRQINWPELARSAIWYDALPLTLLTTVAAFAIMTAYQPKVDPTRAAVIYLCEPLFAAGFAWWHNGRSMSVDAIAGAGLILAANIIAELPSRRVESRL